MKQLKIGDIKLKNPLFLSPMVDVTDLPYRLVCRKSGAAIAYTEMLHINQILHENKKTLNLLKTNKEDKPVGIQITGDSIKQFQEVIPHVKKYDLVDINCGCPSIKIIGNQAGSYLLKNPDKIAEMIKTLKKADLTVTAKIRLGFNSNNVIKVSKIIEKAGADLLTVHARLAIHGSSIPADWKQIEKVKHNLGIPVVGNGDIINGETAKAMLEIADGAMIARAAIGDPEIFERILYYLKTGKEKPKSFKNNLKYLDQYIKLSKKYETIDISRIKYIASNTIKGIKYASANREKLMKLKTYNEIMNFVDELKQAGPDNSFLHEK